MVVVLIVCAVHVTQEVRCVATACLETCSSQTFKKHSSITKLYAVNEIGEMLCWHALARAKVRTAAMMDLGMHTGPVASKVYKCSNNVVSRKT